MVLIRYRNSRLLTISSLLIIPYDFKFPMFVSQADNRTHNRPANIA